MLSIRNLTASAGGKQIINGINLTVNPGEVHAIMGPNGSGKSTLANVIVGKELEEVGGEVLFKEENLLNLDPEQRAREGIFLAFQHPVEIPGISNLYFIRAAVNAMRKHRGESQLDAIDFLKLVRVKAKQLGIDESFLHRSINDGFSGGEKKRNEILQLTMLEPILTVMDETDSGLDIDALKVVSKGVNSIRGDQQSIIVITHFPRILEYIEPDFVHVLVGGKIVKSGNQQLAHELEKYGYGWILEETPTVTGAVA